MSNTSKKVINANPTKEFFISMLVRDISVNDAIGDLIDNSIDGAKRLAEKMDIPYSKLEIKITADKNKFIIEDNCGGIPVEVAEKYAFRFGRPEEMETTDWSIGQFGIGMKRALFKLGKSFSVHSSTHLDTFDMSVNTDEWKGLSAWQFEFDSIKEFKKPVPVKDTGTIIEVDQLNKEIKGLFDDVEFLTKLKNEIELENLYNIHKGIRIYFNKTKLRSKQLNLLVSDDYSIAEWENSYDDDQVNVRLLVGFGKADSQAGGWYIFCNDRLVVGPDQSSLTGWTGRGGDGVANYHSQFNRFRGFAFFDAKNSALLPWDTTKTKMNRDSSIFTAVRKEMIEMMAPFMNFANALKKENESSYQGEKVLTESIKKTTTVNLATVREVIAAEIKTEQFSYPEPLKQPKVPSNKGKITFMAGKDKIKQMKSFFEVSTQNEVGQLAFDYVYDSEVKDNPDYE